MKPTLKQWLIAAYKSENPFETLNNNFNKKNAWDYTYLQLLMENPKLVERGTMDDIVKEYESYLETNYTKQNEITQQYVFCHFATSVCHLFGKFDDYGNFFPNKKDPIIAYGLKPNEPVASLWIDFNDDHEVKLMQENGLRRETLKVQLLQQKEVVRKVTIDFKSREIYECSKGNFLQITVPDGRILQTMREDCVLLITHNGRFINMYFKKMKSFVILHST